MSRRIVFSGSVRGLIRATAYVALAMIGRAAFGTEADALADSVTQQVRAVFGKCCDAVVKIQATDQHGQLSGTGFFIDPNGTIYTSYTIGGETEDIVVLHGGTKYPATRLLADSRSGISILKIEKKTPFLTVGKTGALAPATPVMIIGYPMDLPLASTLGTMGGFDLKYQGRYFSTAHIRANVAVQRGEGGAPLVNLKGEAIGILISSAEGNRGCFALPIEAAEKVRRDFTRFGEVRAGWIGITVGAGGKPDAPAVVEALATDAPAAKCGVQKGDVLVQVGDTKINSPEDVLNASFYLSAGDEVPVEVMRGSEKMTLRVQPSAQPGTLQAATPSRAQGIVMRLSD